MKYLLISGVALSCLIIYFLLKNQTNSKVHKGEKYIVYEASVLKVGNSVITTRGISSKVDNDSNAGLSIKIKVNKKDILVLRVDDEFQLDEKTRLKLVELIKGEDGKKGKIIFEAV